MSSLTELNKCIQILSKIIKEDDTKHTQLEEAVSYIEEYVALKQQDELFSGIDSYKDLMKNRYVLESMEGGLFVRYKSVLLPYYNPIYGGHLVFLDTLPIGTEFHVCNGHWDGKIIDFNGAKAIHNGVTKDRIIGEDSYLWVTIDAIDRKRYSRQSQKEKKTEVPF